MRKSLSLTTGSLLPPPPADLAPTSPKRGKVWVYCLKGNADIMVIFASVPQEVCFLWGLLSLNQPCVTFWFSGEQNKYLYLQNENFINVTKTKMTYHQISIRKILLKCSDLENKAN